MPTPRNTVPFRILLVDDEVAQRSVLAGFLRKRKHAVAEAGTVDEAVSAFRERPFDLVLSDYRMPGRTGSDLLNEVRALHPETTVVIMTAFASVEGAVDAMRAGAYDYLTKPIDLDELEILIARIQERTRLLSENRSLKEELAARYKFDGIVSQSSIMDAVLDTAARAAASNAAVLIRGESGTGKELIARAVHHRSPRSVHPFIAVNTAALNDQLLESELFGHERGAFTGADRQRQGRFELADGGTIFLDEIGDISPATQVKLLRVLQEHELVRVGGSETITVDVRVVAATNRDLEAAIRSGTFREDLYYRLNVVSVEIPPLRKRREDVPALLDHFLATYAKENKRKGLAFSREAWEQLLRYDYPGNVRELQNIVQRSVILSREEQITVNDLPQAVRTLASEAVRTEDVSSDTLPARVDRLEKEMIFEALRLTGGNQSKAAERLGLSERNLRYRLKKWGVK